MRRVLCRLSCRLCHRNCPWILSISGLFSPRLEMGWSRRANVGFAWVCEVHWHLLGKGTNTILKTSMEIHHEKHSDVLVVALNGRFDAPSAPEAERVFKTFLQDGVTSVLLDLSGVEYISSGGLRVIIMLTKALEKVQGTLKLCGLTPFVSEVFDITNLSKRYEICATREEGLAAF